MPAIISALPVLLVVTHRPEYAPPWAGQPGVTSLALSRLGRRQGAQLHGKGVGLVQPALV